ncbi:hypothetical protein [Pollutibacter soli]|uniref:hypothetical protein n=1 Tax=Pollutibacter soli TaxID=3034157 RepID=UPI00301340F4
MISFSSKWLTKFLIFSLLVLLIILTAYLIKQKILAANQQKNVANAVAGIESLHELINRQQVEFGEYLFKKDCISCHPARNQMENYLRGILNQMDEKYLILFLTRQDSLVKAKDLIAMDIKKRWYPVSTSQHFKYSGSELEKLIIYLRDL